MSPADLKLYADLVSVAGAGIVFFSWIITNSFQQRYQGAKSSVETAQAENRLFSEIKDMQQSFRGLGGQLLNLSIDLQRRDKSAETRDEKYLRREQFILQVASLRNNASQIDFGSRFCSIALDLTRVLTHKSDAVSRLRNASVEMTSLRTAKNDLMNKIGALVHPGRPIDDDTSEEYRRLDRIYRDELLPGFAPALDAAVNATNVIYREVEDQLATLKRRAKLMSRVAFVAYIFGTAAVILGRVLEKFPIAA
jgi:hypothetical protein